ncbi:hypothetical protein QBC46DRAFT_338677 [Diplogelasinospora grovesii]|uniref:LysM domain-containing protein n=1 Tax=Diplogelasinospora grovesii TaxID=303347 RepID=A0AAN6NDF6_9PEZI|nr:hypothetical protein QBC46DRAFT_338677 [Diplogelasinospora grovesii]
MLPRTILATFFLAATAAAGAANAIPKYPFDPNTTKFCFWWLDNDGTWTCQKIEDVYGVAQDDFLRWNPSVKTCGVLPADQSFCIAANEVHPSDRPTPSRTIRPDPVTSVITIVTTITANPTSSNTIVIGGGGGGTGVGVNGIATPQPIQPGMVNNCKSFYFVQPGDSCISIAGKFGVAPGQIIAWNPGARSDCTRLFAGTYCCVAVL